MKKNEQNIESVIKNDSTLDPIKVKAPIDPEQKLEKYDYGKFISNISFQRLNEKIKKTFKKRKMYLIIMQLRNGKYDMFTIATGLPHFKYASGTYFIDPDMARDDVHTGLSSYYYHQDCTNPFKIDFNLHDLRKSMKESCPSVEKAINPFNLEAFINSQVIEKVLKGQELSDELRFVKMITVINLIVAGATLFMMGRSFGWF